MFLPHCHHIGLFPDQFSMQLFSAFAVERELEDRREQEQLEKSGDERQGTAALRSY